jgi:hypothetical protein
MPVSLNYQRGMALLVSLVGMVLLGLIGMAAMVSATQQEKNGSWRSARQPLI